MLNLIIEEEGSNMNNQEIITEHLKDLKTAKKISKESFDKELNRFHLVVSGLTFDENIDDAEFKKAYHSMGVEDREILTAYAEFLYQRNQ